jgi:hypothetical protein
MQMEFMRWRMKTYSDAYLTPDDGFHTKALEKVGD